MGVTDKEWQGVWTCGDGGEKIGRRIRRASLRIDEYWLSGISGGVKNKKKQCVTIYSSHTFILEL